MSRGLGRLQNNLLTTIRAHRKLMTFDDIRAVIRQGNDIKSDIKLRVSFERSLRRALHSLVRDKCLTVLGDGGPGDPFRYFIHPLMIGMMGKTQEARALQKAFETACRDFGGRYIM